MTNRTRTPVHPLAEAVRLARLFGDALTNGGDDPPRSVEVVDPQDPDGFPQGWDVFVADGQVVARVHYHPDAQGGEASDGGPLTDWRDALVGAGVVLLDLATYAERVGDDLLGIPDMDGDIVHRLDQVFRVFVQRAALSDTPPGLRASDLLPFVRDERARAIRQAFARYKRDHPDPVVMRAGAALTGQRFDAVAVVDADAYDGLRGWLRVLAATRTRPDCPVILDARTVVRILDGDPEQVPAIKIGQPFPDCFTLAADCRVAGLFADTARAASWFRDLAARATRPDVRITLDASALLALLTDQARTTDPAPGPFFAYMADAGIKVWDVALDTEFPRATTTEAEDGEAIAAKLADLVRVVADVRGRRGRDVIRGLPVVGELLDGLDAACQGDPANVPGGPVGTADKLIDELVAALADRLTPDAAWRLAATSVSVGGAPCAPGSVDPVDIPHPDEVDADGFVVFDAGGEACPACGKDDGRAKVDADGMIRDGAPAKCGACGHPGHLDVRAVDEAWIEWDDAPQDDGLDPDWTLGDPPADGLIPLAMLEDESWILGWTTPATADALAHVDHDDEGFQPKTEIRWMFGYRDNVEPDELEALGFRTVVRQ